MNKQRKQQLLDAAVDDFLKKQDLREDDIILRRPAAKVAVGGLVGLAWVMLCYFCKVVIAGFVFEGAKWVWKNYPHECPGPVQPPEQQPVQPSEQYARRCPFCHEQLVPGKIHYCK